MRLTRMRGSGRTVSFLLLALAACASPEPTPQSTAVVTIAPESEYLALPTLALEDLGSACAAEEEACATGGLQIGKTLADGSVAYWGLDGKQTQLYRATPGRVLRLGRSGSGPGEYRMPMALGTSPSGDVLGADLMQRRVVRYINDSAAAVTSMVPMPAGVFDLAFVGSELRAFATDLPSTAGDSLPIRVYALDPEASDPRALFTLPTRIAAYSVGDFRPMPPLFAPRTSTQFRDDGHLFVNQGTDWLIDEFDSAGVHVARFGFDVKPRAITEAATAAAKEQALRRMPAPMRQALGAAMRAGPTHYPAVTRLVALSGGALWVRESPGESGDSVQWIVYSASARARGRITLGEAETVLGTDGSRLLVVREDAQGASALRWMRLR